MPRRSLYVPLAALAAGVAARKILRRARAVDLRGQVALVTGSSRGLGLALAREVAANGCRLVLCARDPEELERARQDVAALGVEVLAVPCDVSDRDQVRGMVQQATARFGQIDILINNAGVIIVGPFETQTLADFEEAMAVMYWGVVYPTLEVLPSMRARGKGRIANITSIGGKVSVPHLASYAAAKFAAVGFSEGLHAEAAKDGIVVTTVVPGLMRTGSQYNAVFKGHNRAEFSLFTPLATLPISSIEVEKAARQIVEAIREGRAEITLTWQAQVLARMQGVAPGLTADLLSLVNRVLPGSGGIGTGRATGFESRTALSESPPTAMGQSAARRFNQL